MLVCTFTLVSRVLGQSHINLGLELIAQVAVLGQLWLGEARLAHLRRLAHGDVALCQWPLGEGLGGPVLASLAVWSVALTGTLVCRSTNPLSSTTPGLTLHSSTTCSRAVGLTQVTGWRHWGHHQVEGYGKIHRGHVTRAGPNHPNLVVSLKVHVGRTSCSIATVVGRARNEGLTGVIHRSAHKTSPRVDGVDQFARLAELHEALPQVVEGSLHEDFLLLVVVQQVVPQRLLGEGLGVSHDDYAVPSLTTEILN